MMTLIFLDGLNGINYHRLMTPFLRMQAEENLNIHFFQSYNELKEFDMSKVKNLITSRRCTVSNHKAFKKFLVDNNVKLILDNDDFWQLPKDNPARSYYEKTAGPEIKNTIEIADEIWCPSEYLINRMKKINPNVTYRLIPNTLHEKEEQWRDVEKEPTDVVRFGYVGANGHQEDMKAMGNVTLEGTESYCMGLMNYMDILKAKHKLMPKDVHQYGTLYKHFDVSISPLLNNKFNRCKSELKVVEAGYTKTALIASNVSPYKQVIKHNKTGILCSSPGEWRKAIDEMTLERAQELGENLYKYCKKHYNLSKINKLRMRGL
jgi:glycosyltransferase involved in cell wall biosynthesis